MQAETTATPQSTAGFKPGDLVDEREAAAILGCALMTLRNWRWKHEGPRYRKVGRRLVRYAQADLVAFIEGCGVRHE